MTCVAAQDAAGALFLIVPAKGPVSLGLDAERFDTALAALDEIKLTVDAQRPGRSSHPCAVTLLNASAVPPAFGRLGAALAQAGFQCVGALADGPHAEALADVLDLLPQVGATGATGADLARAQIQWEEAQFLKAWAAAVVENAAIDKRAEALAWDEALDENVRVDEAREAQRLEMERLRAEEAAAWEMALAEDANFNATQEAKAWDEAQAHNAKLDSAAEALAWDEAMIENTRIDEAREALRRERERLRAEEEAAWAAALVEDMAFDQAAEAQAWQEAINHDALFEQAEAAAKIAADRTRRAVMSGAPSAFVLSSEPLCRPALASAVPETRAIGSHSNVGTAILEVPAVVGTARAVVHRERVRSGGQVYAEGCDLILFDAISSGAEAMADGNIHAYGPVHGRLLAGVQGDTSAHIVCQKFFGELVAIGGRHATSETLPDSLRGQAVHFWLEDDGIHYRTLVN